MLMRFFFFKRECNLGGFSLQPSKKKKVDQDQ
jgi:hypothetical protein